MGAIPMIGVLAARDYVQHDRVVARLAHGRRVITVRAKHIGDAELRVSGDQSRQGECGGGCFTCQLLHAQISDTILI